MNDAVDNDAPILGIARKWWIVATFTPSLMLLGVDATILDIPQMVIIPELRDNDHYRFQWATGCAVLGSLLGMASLRWLRDNFGLKQVYIVAMAVTVVASIPCGMAETLPLFAFGRFFQSIGKGIVVTNVLATIWREFPKNKDLATGLYAVGIYFGKALGPPVGAFFTDYPSWRWMFYAHVPVGVITLILSWWVLLPDKPTDAKPGRFDFLGLGLLASWVIALMVALLRGQKWGWHTSREWCVVAVVFVVAFLAFVIRQIWATSPLMDLSLFRRRTFVLSVGCKSIFMIAFGAVLSVLCDYMVGVRGYPRTTTGLVLLPGGLVMGASLILSALIGMRWSRKWRLVTGVAGLAVAIWLLSGIDLYTDKHWIGACFVLWGFSAGTTLPPLIVLPMEGLTQSEVVSSASIKNMVRVLPSTIGSLLVGIILTRRSDAHFDAMRQDITYNRGVVEQTRLGLADHMAMRGSSGMRLDEQVGHVIGGYIQDNAKAFAFDTALKYLALLCVVGLIFALLIRPPTTDSPR